MSNIVVYIFTLLESGVFYIGSTKHLERRIKEHLCELNKDRHKSIKLQKAWSNSIDRSILVNSIQMSTREEAFLKEEEIIKSAYNGSRNHLLCNLSLIAKGSDSIKRHPDKEKIIHKRSKTMKAINLAMTPERRKERFIESRLGTKNGMFGRTHTPETRLVLSQKMKGRSYGLGRKLSAEHIEKIKQRQRLRIGHLNSFYGKHHNTKTKEILRQNKLGITPTNARTAMAEGIVFKSCSDISKYFKISPGLVTYRMKNSKYKNWFYIDNEITSQNVK